MLVRDKIYMVYQDRLQDVQSLYHTGFTKFIESKRYLKARKKYLEIMADLPNRTLDARVNSLLMDEVHGGIPARKPKENNIIMENKERSPRKEKKKQKKKQKK